MSASCRIAPPASACLEIRALARREVVDHGDAVAAGDQRVDEIRADEPGAAGDETVQSTASACQKQPGPCRHARHGPDQRTTLVGLGAVRDPRERGRCSRARSTSLSRPTAYRCRALERKNSQGEASNLPSSATNSATFVVRRRWCSLVSLVELPSAADAAVQGLLRVLTLRFVSVSRPRGIQTTDMRSEGSVQPRPVADRSRRPRWTSSACRLR